MAVTTQAEMEENRNYAKPSEWQAIKNNRVTTQEVSKLSTRKTVASSLLIEEAVVIASSLSDPI